MKKLMVLILMLEVFPGVSQQVEPLIFREKIYDFGPLEEEKGLADHEFVFTNNSGRPVRILSVDASCGCTTPGWTQGPIAQGKTGFVKASFNPRGRPGYFNKTLTVLTDWDPNRIILQIKGEVIVGKELIFSDFPVKKGNIHFKTQSFNFGKAFINKDPIQKEFPLMNAGSAPIRFTGLEKPEYITVAHPSVLGPGERGVIKITFDARQKNQFGFASDNILFTTDDPGQEVKSMSVYASLEEYYPSPVGEAVFTVPVLLVREPTIDLGRFRSSANIDRSVTIKNSGKRDLLVKALQGNCTCISASIDSKTIHGGDSTLVRISFKPQNRGGTQQKSITVYSNDPRNPVQRINVQAFIEE